MNTIKLNGTDKVLKFTLGAVRRFRGATVSTAFPTGIPIWKVRLPDGDGVPLIISDSEIMTKVVWAGLLHADRDLTLEQVEGWLEAYIGADSENALVEIFKSISGAFDESGLFGLKRNESEDKEVGVSPNV